jgi:hypothetical protein
VIAPTPVRIAVLPIENRAYGRLASALNGLLQKVKVPGVDEQQFGKVTLEVVQLAIECVDATADCYTAVGQSLNSNELLFAQIFDVPTKRRKKLINLVLTRYDVDRHTTRSSAQHVFTSEAEALAQLKGLLDLAVGPAPAKGGTALAGATE